MNRVSTGAILTRCMQFTLETVREVARLAREAGLGEVNIESAGEGEKQRLIVRRGAPAVVYGGGPLIDESILVEDTDYEVALEYLEAESASSEPAPVTVTSTAVGVYRAPAGAPEAGTKVRAGQTVAIVESLKIPSEIATPVAGTVLEVLVIEGQGVEYGQPLMTLSLAEDSASK